MSNKDFSTLSFIPRLFDNKLFNHELFNFLGEKFMFEESGVKQSGVEMSCSSIFRPYGNIVNPKCTVGEVTLMREGTFIPLFFLDWTLSSKFLSKISKLFLR